MNFRPVLGQLEQLQAKVAEQDKRIRELEEGLAMSHAYRSNSTHPLLQGTHLDHNHSESPESTVAAEIDLANLSTFGSLTVSSQGDTGRLGLSAESLLHVSNSTSSRLST